jgi:RNA-directed DNA polymerase
MVTPAFAGKLDTDQVNGPRDDKLEWDAIYWRPVEDDVRRLRRRIFKASQDGGSETRSATCRTSTRLA